MSLLCPRNVPVMLRKCPYYVQEMCLPCSGKFLPRKISQNLSQWHCAKFSHTPKFLPERIWTYCKFVNQLDIGPSPCIHLPCFALTNTFNGDVCLLNCLQWQRWWKRPSMIWELCNMPLQNCHVAQQCHVSKSHFTLTTFTEYLCI